jgi:hypothetical protein
VYWHFRFCADTFQVPPGQPGKGSLHERAGNSALFSAHHAMAGDPGELRQTGLGDAKSGQQFGNRECSKCDYSTVYSGPTPPHEQVEFSSGPTQHQFPHSNR